MLEDACPLLWSADLLDKKGKYGWEAKNTARDIFRRPQLFRLGPMGPLGQNQ